MAVFAPALFYIYKKERDRESQAAEKATFYAGWVGESPTSLGSVEDDGLVPED